MYETTSQIAVRCTPTQAFDHVARGFFAHHQRWDPTLISMWQTSPGPIRVGTLGVGERRIGRSRSRVDFNVTVFEPDRRLAWVSTSETMHQLAELTIDDGPGGTQVWLHVRLEPTTLSARLF